MSHEPNIAPRPTSTEGPDWQNALRGPYETYWRDSADGLFAVRVVGPRHFVYLGLNPTLERSLGLTQAQIEGRQPGEFLPAKSAATVTARYQACVEAGRPINYHEVLTFPTGRKLCETTLVPFVGETGGVEMILGSCRDAETPKEADEHGQFPSLLFGILDSIDTSVCILDLTGRIQMVNAAWRRFAATIDAPSDAYCGESYLALCERATANGDPDAESVRQGLLTLLAGARASFSRHYRVGDLVFQLRATRIDRGVAPWIFVTHNDVTEVADAQEELSRLAEQVLTVQEEERRRIALELHDSTSQHLVALQLGLTAVRRGRATAETLDDMRRELEEAHREIRTLSYLLHPPALADDGLAATLRAFIDGFRARTGMTVLLTTEGAIDALPFKVQRSLFRVVQEAMANAHRHAKARQITVALARKPCGVELSVADDGRGAGEGATLRPGVGVPGMEARIRLFQGDFSITPTPKGTRIDAFIPESGVQAAHTKHQG